jgi:hypothetical protein
VALERVQRCVQVAVELDVASYVRAREAQFSRRGRQVPQCSGGANLDGAERIGTLTDAAVVGAEAHGSVVID